MERRHTTRYNFGAIAEVIDLGSRTEFVAITRDLSLSGCFIKTTTPLAEGAEIRVRITSSGEDFAAIGKVTRNLTPVGMGIEFVEIAPNDQAITRDESSPSAEEVLKRRYARGEIGREEYESKLEDLRK
jgi:hypothetical protein